MRLRVFILGGTGFTGPHVVRRLADAGCEITLLHRGETQADLPGGVRELSGTRCRLEDHAAAIGTPDLFIDMIPYRRDEARATAAWIEPRAKRVLALSSADVYLSYGRLWGTEPGDPVPVPHAEDAPLRAKLSASGEAYDKTGVEEEYARIGATILRLPGIYGPRDRQHRLHSYLQRMDDGRPSIVLSAESAGFRFARAYVEDVAHAIALAALAPRARGRCYNVSEPATLTEREWIAAIAAAAGWDGTVVEVPGGDLPEPLRPKVDYRHDLVLDTTRIRDELGYAETMPPSEALRRTVAWERAHPPDPLPETNYDLEDEVLSRRSG